RVTQALIRASIVVIAANIVQLWCKPRERGFIEMAMLFQALSGTRAELIGTPRTASHTDDRHSELIVVGHGLERREDLLCSEVAGRAEEDQRIAPERHQDPPATGCRSWCPPNSKRIAPRL